MISNSSITTPSYNKIAFGAGGQQIAKAVRQEIKKEAKEYVKKHTNKINSQRVINFLMQTFGLSTSTLLTIANKQVPICEIFCGATGVILGRNVHKSAIEMGAEFAKRLHKKGYSLEAVKYGVEQIFKNGGDIIGSHPLFNKKLINKISTK